MFFVLFLHLIACYVHTPGVITGQSIKNIPVFFFHPDPPPIFPCECRIVN